MSETPDISFNHVSAVPETSDDLVFREGDVGKFAAFAIFATLGMVCIGATLWIVLLPGYQRALGLIPGFYSVILGLLTWVAWRSHRAALGPMNWLLRATPRGLYVKFRSYLNHGFPEEDRVVVFVPTAEIAWLRAHRRNEKRHQGDPKHANIDVRHDYLEIGLKGADLSALAEQLAIERAHREPGQAVFRHYPVSIREGGIIAVEWRSGHGRTRPRIAKAVKQIESLYPSVAAAPDIAPGIESADAPIGQLAAGEQDDHILELAVKGEITEAVKLVRSLYGYDLTQAKTFVDGLTRA